MKQQKLAIEWIRSTRKRTNEFETVRELKLGESKNKMSSDNGIVSNVQVKTFDGMQKTLGAFWFYFKALLMTKDLLDVLLPEFKNELPDSE